MIKVTIQGNTTPEDREFAVIAGGNCLFRGELSPELQASDIWAEIGRLLENYSKPDTDDNELIPCDYYAGDFYK
jgi:hypothetical protein